MKNIIEVLESMTTNYRYSAISELAEKRNGERWDKAQREMKAIMAEMREKGVDALKVEDVFIHESTMLQDAAYLIGLFDGMKMAKMGEEITKMGEEREEGTPPNR